jgi:hypothetical protein
MWRQVRGHEALPVVGMHEMIRVLKFQNFCQEVTADVIDHASSSRFTDTESPRGMIYYWLASDDV